MNILDEEQKNVDNNIVKCRNSLFSLLGHTFAFNCALSPTVLVHIWRTCNLPVLLSGLNALPIRTVNLASLTIFHKKILRGILKLSLTSPIPALHFLLGELPVEGLLHIRTLGLFYNLWSNPNITIFSIVKYILKMSKENSTTWANHIRILCLRYGLPSPLSLLEMSQPWSKEAWSTLVKAKVINFHEKLLRDTAFKNSKMKYLNTELLGLSGRPYPILLNVCNKMDVKKLRLQLKFLTCDVYFTGQTNPSYCDLCGIDVDCISKHLLMDCKDLLDIKNRLYPELLNIVKDVQPTCKILALPPPSSILIQFLLDCTSINLPEDYRIPSHNPSIGDIFRISRDWCFAAGRERHRILADQTGK